MIWGIVGCSVSPQRARLIGGAVIALNQDFYSAFLAKMDVKKDYTSGYTPVRTYALPDKRVNWHNWELRWPIEVILGANCTKTATWTYLSCSEVSSDTTTGPNITLGGHEGFSAHVTPLVFLSGHNSA